MSFHFRKKNVFLFLRSTTMDMAKHINKISLKSFLISFLCSKQCYDIQKDPKFKTFFLGYCRYL